MTSSGGIWGHHRYADGYPNLRWASQGGINAVRIVVDGDEFVIAPLGAFRRVLRMPEVRVPVSAVTLVLEIGGGRGVRFVTPSRPDLDGTCFKANSRGGGRELVALIRQLGIPSRCLSRRERLAGFWTDIKAQQKAGRRWLRSLRVRRLAR